MNAAKPLFSAFGIEIEYMAEEDQDQYVAMKGRRQQGYSDIYEHRLTRRDGLRLWVLASASPLYDASGRYLGALGMTWFLGKYVD